jgi:hypothetical protein
MPLAGAETVATAQEGYHIEIVYGVSALGLSVGSMTLKLDLADASYKAQAFVQPEGLASSFTSNTVSASTAGWGELGKMTPTGSWNQQVSSKRTQTVSITYKDGNPVSVVADPVYEQPENERASEAEKTGTFDPLGGVIALMLLPGAGTGDQACGASIPVYDGKRAYAFDMWSGGMTSVKRGAGGYQGPVLSCVGTYRRIAGWDAKHMAKGTSTKINVQLAPIGKSANGGPAFYIPVRMWADADIGEVVAIPVKVTINGKDWAQFFADGG